VAVAKQVMRAMLPHICAKYYKNICYLICGSHKDASYIKKVMHLANQTGVARHINLILEHY
jgi:hypothetical protein